MRLLLLIMVFISHCVFAKPTMLLGPYNSIITDIKFIDEQDKVGLVSTMNGLYKTMNGGESWAEISSALPIQSPDINIHSHTRPIEKVETNDGELIYVLYVSGQLYSQPGVPNNGQKLLFVTDNGGASWKEVKYTFPPGANYIKLSKNNELYLYNQSCLYKKSDINSDFVQLSCPKSERVFYVNEHLIFASESIPRKSFMKSTDGGVTWENLTPFGTFSGPIYYLLSATDQIITALKRYSITDYSLAISKDQGGSWSLISNIQTHSTTNGVHDTISSLSNGNNMSYAGGDAGGVYQLNENNANILVRLGKRGPEIKNFFYNAIKVMHIRHKTWIGTNSGLYKYDEDRYDDFFDIDGLYAKYIYKKSSSPSIFVIPNNAYNQSKFPIFYSSDEGLTWKIMQVDQGVTLQSMYISEQNTLYALSDGDNATLYKSINNGEIWDKVREINGLKCQAHDLVVTSERIYCLSGSYYTSLFDKADGLHQLKINAQVPQIAFKDQNHLVGFDNINFYKSDDGGLTWVTKGKSPLTTISLCEGDDCLSSTSDPFFSGKIKLIYLSEGQFALYYPKIKQKKYFNPDEGGYKYERMYGGVVYIFNEENTSNLEDFYTTIPQWDSNLITNINFSAISNQYFLSYTNNKGKTFLYNSRDRGKAWSLETQGDTAAIKDLISVDNRSYFIMEDRSYLYNNGIFELH